MTLRNALEYPKHRERRTLDEHDAVDDCEAAPPRTEVRGTRRLTTANRNPVEVGECADRWCDTAHEIDANLQRREREVASLRAIHAPVTQPVGIDAPFRSEG